MDCLWCNELRTKKEVINRGNYFCDVDCYGKASRVIRMSIGSRKTNGKSGIQAMLLGLLVKTLKQYPNGLVLKDLISFTHKEHSDYSKLLTANKLYHYFRIYLKPDVFARNMDNKLYTYTIVNGDCLKDWLRPQYVEYLESF